MTPASTTTTTMAGWEPRKVTARVNAAAHTIDTMIVRAG